MRKCANISPFMRKAVSNTKRPRMASDDGRAARGGRGGRCGRGGRGGGSEAWRYRSFSNY